MVFMSGNTPKRTPRQQALRYLVGTVTVAAIIYALSLIPYDILREERFRVFGEASVIGVVTDTVIHGATNGRPQHLIRYTYVDQDGIPRKATAELPQTVWNKYRKGSRIRVIYARSHPSLARVEHEIEPPFQLWLRNIID